jgi:hypothetical protein
MIMAPDLNPH